MRWPTPPTGPDGAGITNTAPRPATTPATELGSHDQRSTTAVLGRAPVPQVQQVGAVCGVRREHEQVVELAFTDGRYGRRAEGRQDRRDGVAVTGHEYDGSEKPDLCLLGEDGGRRRGAGEESE